MCCLIKVLQTQEPVLFLKVDCDLPGFGKVYAVDQAVGDRFIQTDRGRGGGKEDQPGIAEGSCLAQDVPFFGGVLYCQRCGKAFFTDLFQSLQIAVLIQQRLCKSLKDTGTLSGERVLFLLCLFQSFLQPVQTAGNRAFPFGGFEPTCELMGKVELILQLIQYDNVQEFLIYADMVRGRIPGGGIAMALVKGTLVSGDNAVPDQVEPVAADTAEKDPAVIILFRFTSFLILTDHFISLMQIGFQPLLDPGKILFGQVGGMGVRDDHPLVFRDLAAPVVWVAEAVVTLTADKIPGVDTVRDHLADRSSGPEGGSFMAGIAAASEVFDPFLCGSIQFPQPHGNGVVSHAFQRPGKDQPDEMRHMGIKGHMVGTLRIIGIAVGKAFAEYTLGFPDIVAGRVAAGQIPAEEIIHYIFQDHSQLSGFGNCAVIAVIDGDITDMEHGEKGFQIISCLHIIPSQP